MTDTARTGNSEGRDMHDAAGKPAPRVGRRKMILGVAAAGVGASVVAGAEPAGATDGNPVLLGESNKASATTTITNNKGVALECVTSHSNQVGVFGVDSSSGGGYGLYGVSDNGTGIYGSIVGNTKGQSAIQGVDGSSGGGYGVYGMSSNGTGIYGDAATDVYGTGVYGNASGDRCDGVYGTSPGDESTGVYGNASGEFGTGVSASASGENGIGVFGYAEGTGDSYGVYASSENSYALYVDGTSDFTGAISKPSGSFKIDHPVDPAGKYLYHSFVESPDMKNVYDGTVTLDGDGRATVELPDWFEKLNRDYRYQLTALGSSAPDLHISREVQDGTFSVAGGTARQKVSWQVTGIRQDAWANANRIPVEVEKKAEDQGRYLHPELFGGEAITALAKARKHARRVRHTTPT